MTELTKLQTEKATELLGLLCKKGNLDNVQIAEFFDNDDDEAMLICKYLQSKDLLKIVPAQVNKIAGIDKRDETCNNFRNNLLMKEFKKNERLEKTEINEFKIKRIELWKQYKWLVVAILGIIALILSLL